MIQISPQVQIFIAIDPVDFRCGIDRLAASCRKLFEVDPKDEAVFVFCNRSRQSIKLLFHDSNGFWLCQKRLSRGYFEGWPQNPSEARATTVRELLVLLWDGKPQGVFRAPWKPLKVARSDETEKK